MKRNRFVGFSTVLAMAMSANFAWAQLVPSVPAVPDVVPDVTNSAKDTARDAINSARGVLNDAQDTARDAQRDATNTAKDAAKNAQDTAKDAQKDASKAAQDATRNAQDTARDAQRDATKAARDAGRNARDAARDATDDLGDTTRDATRNARDAARDATDGRTSIDARGNVRARGSVSGRQGNYRGADLGVWFDTSARNGLIIADVAANAALSGVGLREGDRIISVAGQNVATEADFVRYLVNSNVRGPLNVIVLRDGQQQTLVVNPGFLNQPMTTVQLEPLEQFGIIPDDRINDRIVVWRVVPRSPAFYAGIRTGDVITSFANQPVGTLAALAQLALQTRAGTIPIQVTRNGQTRLVQADFPALQTSDRHTTFRQNLDADVRTNIDTGVRLQDQQLNGRANANVTGELDTDQTAPAITTQPQYYREYNNTRSARRAARRGR